MPRRKDEEFGTFNDGVLSICETEGRKMTKTKYAAIRFGNRVVGVKRFWSAKLNSQTVDRTVAVPKGPKIGTLDMALIGETQYKILQVQEIFDAKPPELLLSLEENKILFSDERKRK